MNSGPTSERVYAALKRLILDRTFRPGERLDPARLSEALNSSVTPVRDALHMLVGETLVETRTGEGFQIPPLDEPGLKDLYAWNAQLLLVALRSWQLAPIGVAKPRWPRSPEEVVEATGALFAAIGRRSRNAEHERAIAALNDRLSAVRLTEAAHLNEVDGELAALDAAFARVDAASLRKLINAYHRRRTRAAAELVRGLYRWH